MPHHLPSDVVIIKTKMHTLLYVVTGLPKFVMKKIKDAVLRSKTHHTHGIFHQLNVIEIKHPMNESLWCFLNPNPTFQRVFVVFQAYDCGQEQSHIHQSVPEYFKHQHQSEDES